MVSSHKPSVIDFASNNLLCIIAIGGRDLWFVKKKNIPSYEQAPSKRLMSAAKAGACCSKLFQEVFTMHSTLMRRGGGNA